MHCPNCATVLATPTPNTCPNCGHLLIAIPAAFALPKLVGAFTVAGAVPPAPVAPVVVPPAPVAPVVVAPVASSKWNIATFVVAMLGFIVLAIFAGLWLAKGLTTAELINVAANVQTDIEAKVVADGNATRTAAIATETNVKNAIAANETAIKAAITSDGNATRTEISDARKAMRRAIAKEALGKATKVELDAAEARLTTALKAIKIQVEVRPATK